MSPAFIWLAISHSGHVSRPLGMLLGSGLLLGWCSNGGNQGRMASQACPTPVLARQVVDNLLTFYRTALRQADIDRVDTPLATVSIQDQAALVAMRRGAEQPPCALAQDSISAPWSR